MGRRVAGATIVLLALAPAAGSAAPGPGPDPHPVAEEARGLPFFAGERFVYRVRAGKLGTVGRGAMTVEGPESVRGRSALLLSFDFRTRIGPVTVEDRTRSWLDPERMAALRYTKRERHPLSSRSEAVEMFPEERRWEAGDGTGGGSPTDAPLDELSFVYYVRTLPLEEGAVYYLNRHFDPDRNPVVVRVTGRERVEVPAGAFDAVVVEMRVTDAAIYRGSGTIRLYLTDDGCRLPLRIESSMPVVGSLVLSLESHTHPVEHSK